MYKTPQDPTPTNVAYSYIQDAYEALNNARDQIIDLTRAVSESPDRTDETVDLLFTVFGHTEKIGPILEAILSDLRKLAHQINPSSPVGRLTE